MRVDGKPEGLRQSMSWFHTYSGLLLGWLLFAIFFTGTFSYFRTEVNDWMRPELHRSVYDEATSIPMALAILQQRAPDAESWSIGLPGPRSLAMTLSWRDANQQQAGNDRRGGNRLTIDAATGEELKPRETRASGFFYRFHFELHGVTRQQGRWIVGIATLLMFAAIISGVITHKKIFTDFFTFRPKKGQRSWLDAHNATAVLALPFHVMITFSGLLLIAGTLLPSWSYPGYGSEPRGGRGGGGGDRGAMMQADNRAQQGRGGAEGGRNQGMEQQRRAGNERAEPTEGRAGREGQGRGQQQAAREPQGGRGQGMERAGEQERTRQAQGQQGSPGNPSHAAPVAPLEKSPMVDIAGLLTQANARWPTFGVGSISISNPGTVQAVVQFNERSGDTDIASGGRGGGKSLRFHAVSGELLDAAPVNPSNASFIRKTRTVLTTLHEGRFAGPIVRWLLFLSGVLGTFMAASGMVLWVVKRMPERRKLGRTPISHRLVEILNIAAIAGLCIAFAMLFWMNRLLPADMQGRGEWEVNGFFIAWAASLVHALVFSLFCKQRTLWLQQMAVAAAFYALLPILNPLTGGASLLHSLWHGQISILYVDLLLLGMASLCGSVVCWLLRKPAEVAAKAPRKAPKAAPEGSAAPPAEGAAAPVRRKPPKAPPTGAPMPIPVMAQGEHAEQAKASPATPPRRKPPKAPPVPRPATAEAAGGALLSPLLQAPVREAS